jgi:hypothetical protein
MAQTGKTESRFFVEKRFARLGAAGSTLSPLLREALRFT